MAHKHTLYRTLKTILKNISKHNTDIIKTN